MMRGFLMLVVAWCVLLGNVWAAEIVPGLYRMAGEAPGVVVRRADTTGEVLLRERFSPDFRDVKMASCSNDNMRFVMTAVAGPIPEGGDTGGLALVVAGHCLPVWGHSDRGKDGCVAISMSLQGREVAEEVAKAAGVELKVRMHPGHQFVTSVRPEKEAYAVGEPVKLVMTIQNVGKVAMRWGDGGMQRGPRNNQFSFVASSIPTGPAVPDTGDPTNFGGLIQLVTLKPGESFTKDVNVSNWFKFEAGGSYAILATYLMEMDSEIDMSVATYAWEERATAKCVVRIAGK